MRFDVFYRVDCFSRRSNGFCCPVKKVVRTTRQTKMTYEEQKSDLDVVLDESGPIKLTPEEPECGRSIQSKSKISSSENSTENSWPWMAVLLHIDTYLNFCGGVLINKRFVLSAAHCFKVYVAIFSNLKTNSIESFFEREIRRNVAFNFFFTNSPL